MTKTILLTGYTPFDRFELNPSHLIATALDGKKFGEDWIVVGKSLEVDFKQMPILLNQWWDEYNPAMVLGLGLAYGTPAIRLERFGHNWLEINSPDNAGNICAGEPIIASAPEAYQTNLPVKELATVLINEGIPAYTSDSAGTHLCNMFLYTALHRTNQTTETPKTLSGFVHLPAMPQLVAQMSLKDKNNVTISSMSIEVMQEAVTIILKHLIKA
jgi:pyroglutamyl-peptidase